MPGPLGGAVVELPGVLKGLGRFGRPESSPDSVKKKSLSKKAQSDSLKMIVLDKKNCDLLIRCLQRRLEARLDLSIINQQKSTPESKDPHPIPKPSKILGLGGDW